MGHPGVEALIGSEIAGYAVRGVIGRGGMGVVYLADHLRLGRQVALKVLAPELAHNARFRERFLRESRIAAGLNHPHVIPIHDADEADGRLFIAMQYVEASDLCALLEGSGPLSPARALSILAQIAGALDAAHASGLVHRDVKPGNVLIAQADHAYLTDFGVTKQIESDADATAAGELLGTLAYIAPEQIEGGAIDGRVDVYSLACVLFECLAGRAPFERDSDLSLLWAHVQEEPPLVSAERPELSPSLNAVIASGMAKLPEDRYATCGELIAAAVAAVASDGSGSLPPGLDGLSPPLVGRDAELVWLREHWARARVGRGAVLLVSGERGSGKTRLAAQLAQEAHADDAVVRHVTALRTNGSSAPLPGVVPGGRPMLVVVDDLDAAEPELLAQLAELADAGLDGALLVVCTLRRVRGSASLEALAGRLPDNAKRKLGGVDEDAVAEILALYAGAGARPPLEAALAATDGLPLRVHELAAEWARGEASRRLGNAVERAAGERSELRDAETEVAENVIELQLARERALLYFPELSERVGGRSVSPFKGLAAFEVADAEFFFGRERLVAELVSRLAGASFLGIVGPSGSGKSSVLRAGLLPGLAGGILPGSERWRRMLIRPGAFPLAELREALGGATIERALDELGPDERLLIAVDQFEELFTAGSSHDERERFIDALVGFAEDPRRRAVVIVATRSDYYGRFAESPELAALIGESHVLVGPMRDEELRRAIELPAARARLSVEPALVAALVADVAGEPGGLPLLSTALLELWLEREGKTLGLASYAESGGVRGAVARLAEAAYGGLDHEEQPRARGLLLRLAAGGAGEDAVRRRIPLDELDLDRDEPMRRVLEAFTEARLVTVSAGTAEVAHEALLREWPRLRGWIEDDAAGQRLHRHLGLAAREWVVQGEEAGELYRGPRLAAALDWSAEHEPELNDAERKFLDESRNLSERDARRIRRTNSRLRGLLAAAAVLLLVTLAAGAIALVQQDRAEASATAADARRLGAQAVVEDELDLSLLLAREAFAMEDSSDTRSTLLASLLKAPGAIRVLHGTGDRVLRVLGSADGKTFVTSDHIGGIAVYDAENLALRRIVHLPDQPYWALHPKGESLAAVFWTEDGWRLAFVDLTTGKRRTVEAGRPWGESILTVAYAADGRHVIALEARGEEGQEVATLVRYTSSGRESGKPVSLRGVGGDASIRFGASGDRLAVLDGEKLLVLSYPALDVVRTQTLEAFTIDLSPDGRSAVIGRHNGTVAFVDLATGRVHEADGRHTQEVQSVGFSPDGRTVVSTGDDRNVLVWDVASRSLRETLTGHAGRVFGPAFDATGKTAFTVGLDGRVIAWDLTGERRIGRGFRFASEEIIGGQEFATALSPEGTLLAHTTADGRIQVRDLSAQKLLFSADPWSDRRLEELKRLEPLDDAFTEGLVTRIAFSPDGRLLAVAGRNQEVVLFSVATGRVHRRVFAGEGGWINGVTFAADGRLITAGDDGRAVVWSAGSARADAVVRVFPPLPKKPEDWPGGVLRAAVSPDGSLLATTVAGPTVKGELSVYELESGRRLWREVADRWQAEVAWSPDGRVVATGGQQSGRLTLWDAATGRRIGEPVRANAGFVNSVAFARGGKLVVTAGTDGTLRLWDAATLKQVGTNIVGKETDDTAAHVLPGGAAVMAVGRGRAWIWQLDPARWAAQACLVANRELTRSERESFLAGSPGVRGCGT